MRSNHLLFSTIECKYMNTYIVPARMYLPALALWQGRMMSKIWQEISIGLIMHGKCFLQQLETNNAPRWNSLCACAWVRDCAYQDQNERKWDRQDAPPPPPCLLLPSTPSLRLSVFSRYCLLVKAWGCRKDLMNFNAIDVPWVARSQQTSVDRCLFGLGPGRRSPGRRETAGDDPGNRLDAEFKTKDKGWGKIMRKTHGSPSPLHAWYPLPRANPMPRIITKILIVIQSHRYRGCPSWWIH